MLLAGSRRGRQRWLPHAVVASAGAGLLLLTAYDPEAAIARSARSLPAADVGYLATLSDDAVPEIDALPEPYRSCVLTRRLPSADGGWTSANLARARAREVSGPVAAGSCWP